MRYLILGDIHANSVALETVLEQAGKEYERFICLGDIVGYGPDPNEAVDRVRELKPTAVVRGNHDKACCGITGAEDFNPVARAAVTWTREQLRAENLSYLRELVMGPMPVGSFQIVHGSVLDEDEYIFQTREARESLKEAQVPVTFFGHTHYQGGFALRESDGVEVVRLSLPPGVVSAKLTLDTSSRRYLVNPGSVGQPRDGDARAAFVFYDDKKQEVEYWRVPYDIQATQKKMRDAGLPPSLSDRLARGR